MTSDIDWTDPACQVSPHFTVRDAIWLPQWERLSLPSDGMTPAVCASLVRFILGPMEDIRSALGNKPIITHVTYRPPAYNALQSVGGAPGSAHQCLGPWAAMDWHLEGSLCDDVRKKILDLGLLEFLGLRMENKPGAGWVHLDNAPTGANGRRFFTP